MMSMNKKRKNKLEKTYVLYETSMANNDDENVSFAKYIKEKRREALSHSGDSKQSMSIDEHAELLGLSKEMYRKILNKQKPNQSRDCIIAICATLQLDQDDTDKALHLYGSMPKLDEESPRDELIINVLNGAVDDVIGLDTIDKCLKASGFVPLSIIDHRKKRSTVECSSEAFSCPYQVLDKKVNVSMDEIVYGDPYGSLSTAYDFSRFRYSATMWLDDTTRKCVYKLTAVTNGDCLLETHPVRNETDKPFVAYKSPSESGEFSVYFMELLGLAKNEQKKMEMFLNDTKNYKERTGAGIHNDRIHIYYETYNYALPELQEYYLMEYIDGVYRLSVSKQSLFMSKYLTESEYMEHYGTPSNSVVASFDSIEGIETLIAGEQRYSIKETILRYRKGAYTRMKNEVEKTLREIEGRKLFIRDLSSCFYDEDDRVCEFYGVAKEFDCTTDEEYDYVYAQKDRATLQYADGEIEVTLKELCRAFELGFSSIDEICRVKAQKGSVEAVLK